jgi:transcriptional regulator with PAS, ATPase and Fis domain
MLPKQKSYIPRFALLINSLTAFDNEAESIFEIISEKSVLKAERLSDYFVNMAKKVKIDSREKQDLKRISKDAQTPFEKFKIMHEANPEINRSTAADMLEVSRQTIINWVKKLEK